MKKISKVLKIANENMPTYKEYVEYAKQKGFQPCSEVIFNALVASGYNPITKSFKY